jgi:hypothetical protein
MPEVCDYEQVRREFGHIFAEGRRCVISTDIDGVFSAVLMSHVFDWQVVGFYTLDELFIERQCMPNASAHPESALAESEVVFLDHDVYRVNLDSVGHHILQWSEDTPIPLHVEGRASLNPNLLRGITFREFNRKYPFATFHFLLACANAWGALEGFEPDEDVTALLLHIDSSFVNAINYQDNALDWLNWLGGSEQHSPLYSICKRMLRWSPRVVLERFSALAHKFESLGLRGRRQGEFKNPLLPEKWETIDALIRWFEQETGWQCNLRPPDPGGMVTLAMDRRSRKPNRSLFEPEIAKEPFSYAIINRSGEGFNYNWFSGFAPND